MPRAGPVLVFVSVQLSNTQDGRSLQDVRHPETQQTRIAPIGPGINCRRATAGKSPRHLHLFRSSGTAASGDARENRSASVRSDAGGNELRHGNRKIASELPNGRTGAAHEHNLSRVHGLQVCEISCFQFSVVRPKENDTKLDPVEIPSETQSVWMSCETLRGRGIPQGVSARTHPKVCDIKAASNGIEPVLP